MIGSVLSQVGKKSSVACHTACLETIRILSREKSGLETMTTELALQLMVKHAGLELPSGDDTAPVNMQDADNNGKNDVRPVNMQSGDNNGKNDMGPVNMQSGDNNGNKDVVPVNMYM